MSTNCNNVLNREVSRYILQILVAARGFSICSTAKGLHPHQVLAGSEAVLMLSAAAYAVAGHVVRTRISCMAQRCQWLAAAQRHRNVKLLVGALHCHAQAARLLVTTGTTARGVNVHGSADGCDHAERLHPATAGWGLTASLGIQLFFAPVLLRGRDPLLYTQQRLDGVLPLRWGASSTSLLGFCVAAIPWWRLVSGLLVAWACLDLCFLAWELFSCLVSGLLVAWLCLE